MQPDSAVDNLQAVLELVRCHGSPELAEWITGLDWTHATDGRITDYQQRKKRRDALLTSALVKMSRGTTWTRCSQLAAEIRRFESRIWPRARFKANPPDRFGKLDALLFEVFKIGIKVPGTAQAVVIITQKSSARNLGEGGIE